MKNILFTNNSDCEECSLPLVFRILCAGSAVGAAVLLESSFIYIVSKHVNQLPIYLALLAGIFVIFVGYVIRHFSDTDEGSSHMMKTKQLAM